MTEELLQFIWKNKLFNQRTYISDLGDEIVILAAGEENQNAGPDFINTRIKIGNEIWAGNCEVHLVSSDWSKHSHHTDNAYNNVILHVVLKNDKPAKSASSRIIPTIEIDIDNKFEKKYKELLSSHKWVSCGGSLKTMDRFKTLQWLTSLTIERFERRTAEISKHLEFTKNDWEASFYHFLARSFGFNVNAVPFELLSKSINLNTLLKHKGNLFQIEALFYGQSGLIAQPKDVFSENLLKEYQFLQKKYSLVPLEKHLWKFLRLRPYNFPTIRIAQFASLMNTSSGLFSTIIEASDITSIKQLFKIKTTEYWDNHFTFGTESIYKPKKISEDTIDLLLANAVLPFIFVFGKMKNLPEYCDRAINFLEMMKPEKNRIVQNWEEFGIKARNCFETQALLQLKKEYCDFKKCLYCSIGNTLITN